MAYFWVALILHTIAAAHNQIGVTEAVIDIGVCYGMNGNDLPSPTDVVNLYRRYKIQRLRLFKPDHAALDALRGSQIYVTLGIENEDLPGLASSLQAVNSWFQINLQPYVNNITFPLIVVGNEVIPGNYGPYVVTVMGFLNTVLKANGLMGIKVSTAVSSATMAASYPPSSGAFTADALAQLTDILKLLSAIKSPLLINVYPYFAYASDPVNIRLDYAQFTAPGPVVTDGNLSYTNLFDAMVDSFFWAMERAGVFDVNVVVSESGWPSQGNGEFTTPELAATYNKNFMNHVINYGTPKRPRAYIQGFIFAMFNENLKPPGVQQNFGLFYPNMQPVYSIFT